MDDEEQQTAAAAVLMSMCNGTRLPNGENACKTEAVQEKIVHALCAAGRLATLRPRGDRPPTRLSTARVAANPEVD